jgi:lipopolysaccharide transport system ATP-binding protein
MSDIVIKAENLGKMYTIGHQAENRRYVALRDVLMQNARTLWNKTKDLAQGKPIIQGDTLEEVWALKDLSFEIQQGEVVGIIGRNGAGKSTLLKVLSRITEPSTGRVTIKGRVASLLEVGTGFHPELTGRENIYLNGAILGMTRADIKRKFDEIVAFAEVERYLDTPVKRYSSGMYVRLAFAVAAHLEPEILVVDEVLAVGDVEFQKKCLGKMGAVAREGRTVLFVSHNMISLRMLCVRGILLKSGKAISDGDISAVINTYLNSGNDLTGEMNWPSIESAPGDDRIRLKAVRIVSMEQATGYVDIDKEFRIEVDYWNLQPDHRHVVIELHNSMGVTVFLSANMPSACLVPDPWYSQRYPKGLFRTSCTIPGLLLNDGLHSISVYINVNPATDTIIAIKNVVEFSVQDTGVMRQEYLNRWPGAVRPRLDWQTTQLAHDTDYNKEGK